MASLQPRILGATAHPTAAWADRDSKFTDAFDAVLNDAGLEVVKTGVRMPRMYETFCNRHRPHRALGQAAPLRPLPEPTTEPGHITRMEVRRQDRLGGTIHEYRHAA